MEKPQVLLGVSLALSLRAPILDGIPQVLDLINDFLLPATIDFAVYTDLQRVVKRYGSSRTWTCKAMDGAAAKGRLDILQRLRDTRSEGCTTQALFDAATRGHLKVVKWLFQNYTDVCQLEHVRQTTMVLAVSADQIRITKYLQRSCPPRRLKRWTEEASAVNHIKLILACVPSTFSTSEAMQIAVVNGHTSALAILLMCSPSTTDVTLALQTAIRGHRLHMIRMIMHRGNPFNTRRIFCAAVRTGRVDIIDLLLPESDSASIGAALTTALRCGNAGALRFLLERGRSDEPEFLLMKAALAGRHASKQLLLDTWEI